jgi:hypothetical protein
MHTLLFVVTLSYIALPFPPRFVANGLRPT